MLFPCHIFVLRQPISIWKNSRSNFHVPNRSVLKMVPLHVSLSLSLKVHTHMFFPRYVDRFSPFSSSVTITCILSVRLSLFESQYICEKICVLFVLSCQNIKRSHFIFNLLCIFTEFAGSFHTLERLISDHVFFKEWISCLLKQFKRQYPYIMVELE